MAAFLARVTAGVERLKSLGKEVDKDCIIGKVLTSLPAKFSNFRTTWNMTKIGDANVTLLDLQAALLAAEADMTSSRRHEEQDAGAEGEALSAGRRKGFKGKKDKPVHKKGITCFQCGLEGHYKRDCPGGASGSAGKKSTGGPAHAMRGKPAGTALGAGSFDDSWFGDTGAFMHMTHHTEWFDKVLPADVTVTIPDGTKHQASGIGSIAVETHNGVDWEPHVLTDVLLVPALTYNLFSISASMKKGCELAGRGNEIWLSQNGRKVVRGTEDGGLFKMKMRIAGSINGSMAASCACDLTTWHRRLAHLHEEAVKSMMKDELVIGMKGSTAGSLSFCEGCVLGKMTHLPFKSTEWRDCSAGEVIHGDVMGPLPVKSLGGSRYCVVFKDEASSARRVFFVKEKTEVLKCFKTFVSEIEADFAGSRVKVFRSDRGTEFVNAEFNSYLGTAGIKRELSPARSPQSNGFVERDNRTLMERAMSMLHGAGLPAFLWAEAVNTAAHISNRVPCSRHKDTTPYELWYGEKPDVGHLRVFGCLAYYLDLCRQKKLEPKSIRGVFVGYTSSPGIYKIYDKNSRRIIETREVRFNESADSSSSCCDDFADFFGDEDKAPPADADVQEEEDEAFEDAEDKPTLPPAEEGKGSASSSSAKPAAKRGPGRPLGSTSRPKEERLPPPSSIMTRTQAKNDGKPAASGGFAFMTRHAPDPQSVDEALAGDEADEWSAAMDEEMLALADNETWDLESMPADRTAVKCMWIFKKKFTSAGTIDRYKARLVAKGFSQRLGIDYQETYAPVVRYESIRVFLAIATGRDMDMKQFDVRTAFLHRDLHEVIFMDQPAGYEDNTGRKCRLRKGLYGLKQAPRCWNSKFHDFLLAQGFTASNQDRCMYHCRLDDEGEILLVLYVDDGLLASNRPAAMDDLLAQMDQQFRIRSSDPDVFVGLEIQRCRQTKTISIGQSAYISRLVERFNMTDSKPAVTPGNVSIKLAKDLPAATSDFPYREAVGSLRFAMTCTRPDIAYEVSVVAKFVEQPAEAHIQAVKRIIRYLKGTSNWRIRYAGRNLTLESFCDAGFAADIADPRSQAGRIHTLNGGAVSWSSQLMKLVAHSTTEAEFMALDEAGKDIAWLRQLHEDVNCRQDAATCLWSDNQAAIKLVENAEYHPRTRHIAVRFYYIRQQQDSGILKVDYTPTDCQPADMLTKSLNEPGLDQCRQMVQLLP